MTGRNTVPGPAQAEFGRQVCGQRLLGGQLSLRDLERQAKVSKSTIDRMLRGLTVPRWPTVRAVLTAMEAEQIDTVWKKRWMRAYSEHAGLADDVADAAQHPARQETETDDHPLAEPLRLIDGQDRPRRSLRRRA
ncbi:helix-turn-helix domain-containing protein [Actinoallomurus sp. CA-150999]|uniref:helix-turn-helix domain-containing protein n=1 Tax=Actinoallomurus sp. CA-150999 TaxID=3239887 RepID=UPI003D8A2561